MPPGRKGIRWPRTLVGAGHVRPMLTECRPAHQLALHCGYEACHRDVSLRHDEYDANPLYARGPLELTAFLISRYRKHVTT
jgi:hypothetical protein